MKNSPLQQLEQRIWQNTSPNRWEKSLRLLLAVFRIVTQSRIKLFAISLTYSSLLAAVPLLAVLFTLLKSFGIDKVLPKLIHEVLAPMGQSGLEVGQYLLTFVANAQSGLLGGIGLLFLFYSIFSLFRKIEVSLNHIWSITALRPVKKQLLSYLGALMLVVIVATLALGLNVLFHRGAALSDIFQHAGMALIMTYAAKLLSIIVTAIMLALIYSVTINTQVRFRAAFSGGLFCAVLWLPLTAAFAKIMAASSNYSLIYSSFAGLIILLIWLQILWLLFLSGSLVAYFVQFPALLKPYGTVHLNPAELEYYAKRIMQLIIATFKTGKGSVSLSTLTAKTQLSHRQVLAILEPFLREQFIVTIGASNNHFLLAKDEKLISEAVILQTIRGKVRRHAINPEERVA